ncbi:metal-dependent hydrolase [Deltaproteobacteria bacterium Smac51]|nr:metal-dependent hydrolase [Deltaproteobacteria bacterium Smac51]
MSQNPITVTWHGHSNVMISGAGCTFLIDPFFEGNRFAPDWRTIPRPDMILITHSHGDHLGQAVEIAGATGARIGCIADMADWLLTQGVPPERIINGGSGGNIDGTVEEFGVRITQTQATHSSAYGAPIGFVLELPGGTAIYHAGDTGLFSDMGLIGERFNLDLAMLPVGGTYTMDGQLAAKACAMLKTKAAMPLHYATFPLLAADASAFKEAVGHLAPDCVVIAPEPGGSFII